MSRKLVCSYCGGRIEGAVHVEPEGFYHPECFLKTPRAARLAAISSIEEYARTELAADLSRMVERAKQRFSSEVSRHGLTDPEVARAILRGLFRSWSR